MNNKKNNSVLIIEDDTSWQRIISDVLETEDIIPVYYNTVKESLAKLKERNIGVVILDLQIGDEDGMSVLNDIKKINPNIKIIIYTAFASLQTAKDAVNREAFAYLEKMDEMSILVSHVHRALHHYYETYSQELESEVKIKNDELQNINRELQSDIIARKEVEIKLQESIKEKEVLLREIHHRVKNNLQLICSLLNLQANKIVDSRDKQLLLNCQNRVRSMALIHESLYSSDNLSKVNMYQYVEKLITHLLFIYHRTGIDIKRQINIENIFLTVDTAIPCGLIIDEIISNSLKYAFKDTPQGIITIRMNYEKNKYLILKVSDNGVGIPDEFDIDNAETLGLKLINILTKQMNGAVTLNTDDGTTITIKIPLHKNY